MKLNRKFGRRLHCTDFAAQIVSIIEVYCALTDKKNYGREEAFAIMEGEAGTKFNPDIFRICHRISRQLS